VTPPTARTARIGSRDGGATALRESMLDRVVDRSEDRADEDDRSEAGREPEHGGHARVRGVGAGCVIMYLIC
jgi:hypothetical protein